MNKMLLIGNLGRDPETKFTQSGDPVTTLSIATEESWKNKQGGNEKKTEWHRVVFFGRQAETLQQYTHKGSKLFCEGRLQTREWEKDGVKKYTTEIIGQKFEFLSASENSRTAEKPQEQPEESGNRSTRPTDGIIQLSNDDIPF
jgi:single-strand DNA-binding protein